MTETCSSHTWWPPGVELPEARRGSLGTSGPGFEHKVVDEVGSTVESRVVGELCVRGEALARGMVGRLRSEVFDADGWYHTGDSGYRDADGHLYFAGRTDDMVKTSGANVAPVEVEAVLNALPEVREAYVVGLPDADKGAVVAAAVVLNHGMSLTADQLTAACRKSLAAYKVPKRWEVLPDAEGLPYTTTNKIDKRALVELLAEEGVSV
jgi:acyl-coenzyme A synthetase/AMP-(fatty) acid ligase